DAKGLPTDFVHARHESARAHPLAANLSANREMNPMRIREHRGYRVFPDRRRMNSARGRDWDRDPLERSAERVVCARAEQLNPLEAARPIRDVVGHPEGEQHVASAADQLADFLGRSALAIGQDDFDAGHCAGNRGAMRGLQRNRGYYFHERIKTLARVRAPFKQKSSGLSRSHGGLIFAESPASLDRSPSAMK